MAFADDLRDFLNLAHAYAWHQAQTVGKTPDEPGLVSALISKPMLAELERIVRVNVSPSTKVIVDGVFTHKTPTVKPLVSPNSNSVEIADLMLVRQHINPTHGIPFSGRAFLLQAKRNSHPNSGNVAIGNPLIQFSLYKNWPSFEGTTRLSKGALNSPNWSFPVIAGNPYGRYLAVLNGNAFTPPQPRSWTGKPLNTSTPPYKLPEQTCWGYGEISAHTQPTTGVDCNNDFSTLLTDFIHGAAGIAFTPGLFDPSDHWSTFVNEMLSHAYTPNYTFLSSRTGITQPHSRNGRISSFLAAQPIIHQLIRTNPISLNDYFFINHALFDKKFLDNSRWYYSAIEKNEELFDAMSEIFKAANRVEHDREPPDIIFNEQPPDEPGFTNTLSIVTIGDETPEGLLQTNHK